MNLGHLILLQCYRHSRHGIVKAFSFVIISVTFINVSEIVAPLGVLLRVLVFGFGNFIIIINNNNNKYQILLMQYREVLE